MSERHDRSTRPGVHLVSVQGPKIASSQKWKSAEMLVVEYVGGEARVIDGHKCGPSGLPVPNSQQLDHLKQNQ